MTRRPDLLLAAALALLLTFAPAAARAQEDAAVQAAPDPDGEAAVRAMLEAAREAAVAGDTTAFARFWNTGATLNELLRSDDLKGISAKDRTALTIGLGLGLRMGLTSEVSYLAFERMEVRKVEIDGARAVALVRGWDADDVGLTFRYWLARSGDDWKLVDFEELTQGMRVSRLLLAMAGEIVESGGDVPWITGLPALTGAMQASAAGDWEAVAAGLEAVEGLTFPADFEALRAILEGSIALQIDGDPAAAIAAVERAERMSPGVVSGEFLRARASIQLGDPETALASVARLLDTAGPDAAALMMRGEALEILGRHAEALEAFAAAALDAPRDTEVLATWLATATAAERGTPLEHLTRLEDRGVLFEPVVLWLRELAAIEAQLDLFDAFRAVEPDHPDLSYWHARLLLESGDATRAATVLAPTIDAFRGEGALDDEATWPWLALWIEAHDQSGALPASYERAAGSREALAEIGLRLADRGELEPLRALVVRHAELDASAPWLVVLRAEVLLLEEKPQEAEDLLAAFRSSEALEVDELLADAVRSRRVSAYMALGRPADGVAALGPDAVDAFVWRFYDAQDGDGLLAFLDALGEAHAGHPEMASYRFCGLFHAGRYEEALALMTQRSAEILTPDAAWTVHDCAVRALLRTGETEQALQHAERVLADTEDAFLAAVVHIVAGRVEQALETVRHCVEDLGWAPAAFLEDPDAGPPLTSPELKPVRALLDDGER